MSPRCNFPRNSRVTSFQGPELADVVHKRLQIKTSANRPGFRSDVPSSGERYGEHLLGVNPRFEGLHPLFNDRCNSGRPSDMTETGQIIFMVMTIIALAALASMPSWGTAILLMGILGAWAFSGLWKTGQRSK